METSQLYHIVGAWATDGHVVGDPPIPVVGTDVYELFPGGHFLVHHVDVTVGDQPVRAIEIVGEPAPDGDGMLARAFDDQGTVEVMRLTVEDDVFRFTGGPDVAAAAQYGDSPAVEVRATLTVARDGQSMTAAWERSPDGSTWKRWMDISFTRMAG